MNTAVLKEDYFNRDRAGFVTMAEDAADFSAPLCDTTSTIVTVQVLPAGTMGYRGVLFAYRPAEEIPDEDLLGHQYKTKLLGSYSPDIFVFTPAEDAATMGPKSTTVVDLLGEYRRSQMVVRMPRKTICSEKISICKVDVKRKSPRVILDARIHEEENA